MRTGKRVPNTEVYPGAALYKNGEEGGDSGGRGGWVGGVGLDKQLNQDTSLGR